MSAPTSATRSSFESLCSAKNAFASNNMQDGFGHFNLASPQDKNKVYEQIWINRGRPPVELEFGKNSFNNCNGRYTCLQEKAYAIDGVISQRTQDSSMISMNGTRTPRDMAPIYGYRNGQYVQTGEYDLNAGERLGECFKEVCPLDPNDPEYAAKCTTVSVGSAVMTVFFILSFI